MKLKNTTNYIIVTIVIVGILYIILSNLFTDSKKTKTSFALNTYTSVTAYGKNASAAVQNAEKEINLTEQRFSAYIDSSEVSAINKVQKKNTPIHVSDELFNIIKTACKYSQLSGGLFDITLKPLSDLWSFSENPHLPSIEEVSSALMCTGYKNIVLNENEKTITFLKDSMQIDLGAIAKGYAADRVCDAIIKSGCNRALVDLGGNICIVGENISIAEKFANTYFSKSTKPWRIGIQTPFASSGTSCAVLSLTPDENKKISIVTSGAYERSFTENNILYHHILDPRTGYPYNGSVDSVTIIGESSMDADALSTTAFMMDINDALTLVSECGYDAVIIDKNKKIHTTLDKSSVEIVDITYSFAD